MVKHIKLIQSIIAISLVITTVGSTFSGSSCWPSFGGKPSKALLRQDLNIEDENSMHLMFHKKKGYIVTTYDSTNEQLMVKSTHDDEGKMIQLRLVHIPESKKLDSKFKGTEIQEFYLAAGASRIWTIAELEIPEGHKLQLQFLGFLKITKQ